MTSDCKQITADNQDVAQIRVEIVDAKGNIVPTANNLIKFNLKGNGNHRISLAFFSLSIIKRRDSHDFSEYSGKIKLIFKIEH